MKISKLLNIIMIIVIATLIMLATPMKVQAKTADSIQAKEILQLADDDLSITNIFGQGDKFIKDGEEKYNEDNPIDKNQMSNTVSFLYGAFVGIGAVIAIIVGLVLGIKFMMAASADDKAKYKQQLVIYAVGVIVIFGAFGIWHLLVTTLNITT